MEFIKPFIERQSDWGNLGFHSISDSWRQFLRAKAQADPKLQKSLRLLQEKQFKTLKHDSPVFTKWLNGHLNKSIAHPCLIWIRKIDLALATWQSILEAKKLIPPTEGIAKESKLIKLKDAQVRDLFFDLRQKDLLQHPKKGPILLQNLYAIHTHGLAKEIPAIQKQLKEKFQNPALYTLSSGITLADIAKTPRQHLLELLDAHQRDCNREDFTCMISSHAPRLTLKPKAIGFFDFGLLDSRTLARPTEEDF